VGFKRFDLGRLARGLAADDGAHFRSWSSWSDARLLRKGTG
jgi:hypothetical protein